MIATAHLHTPDGQAYPVTALAIPGAPLIDACIVDAHYGHVLILQSDGTLCGANLDTRSITALCSIGLPDLPGDGTDSHFGAPAWRLHASASGRWCAIVVDKGRHGIVVDTASGHVTASLDGGDYYEETVPFSACFVHIDDMDVLIHRTAWNRLDALDPATGRSLVDRHIAENDPAVPRPPHYLDYFHGQLWPNPKGSRILDDGWVWHPVSVPRAWSIIDWIRSNPWESEDGASMVDLALRDDWNTPACWIDDERVALWGLAAPDEEAEPGLGNRPGVCIADVTSCDRSADDRWPIDMDTMPPRLLSDGRRLFIVEDAETVIWDIASRSEVARLPGFFAHLHHAKRGTLIAIVGHTVAELTLQRDVSCER